MCSIILRFSEDGALIGANRDEMLARAWDKPAAWWPKLPGVVAGRDRTGGGTWLGVNRHGLVAAVLNRHGTLGPAPGKNSRGELPLLALAETGLEQAAEKIRALDAGRYRSFNLVLADATGGIFFAGLENGKPRAQELGRGVWMITSGEVNDPASLRIARHLPKFAAAPAEDWTRLLADNAPPAESALNIPPSNGFGTVCSAFITLRPGEARWLFAGGAPDIAPFQPVVSA